MLLYLLYLLPLLPLARAQCSLLSVSGCQPREDEVIITLPLPSDQGAATCQQLCRDYDHCGHWSYDSASLACSLLHHSYLATWDSITGGYEPDYADCQQQDSGTCNDLVRENCDLLGTVLWQSDEVTHTYECQDYLQLLGPVYGGSVFSYSHTSHTCSILDTGARHCSKLSGPKQPSVEQCDTATTPELTTTPEVTTTAPATTSAPANGDGM